MRRVLGDVLREHGEAAGHEANRAVGKLAGAASGDHLEPVPGRGFGRAVAVGLRGHVLDRAPRARGVRARTGRIAPPTGSPTSRVTARESPRADTCRGSSTAIAPQPRPAPIAFMSSAESVTIAAWRGREPGSEVAADEHAAHVVRFRVAEDVSQRSAERDFVHAGSVDAAQRDEHRAGVGRGSRGPPPVRAEAGDERDVGEGLDVVDERRPAVDTALERTGRREGGFGVAAVEPVDERGLLADDVARRCRRHPQQDLVVVVSTFADRAFAAP